MNKMKSGLKISNFSWQSFIAVFFIVCILLPGSGMAGPANSDPGSFPIIEWTLDVQLGIPPSEAVESGLEPLGAKHFTSLVSKLHGVGLSVSLTPLPSGDKADRFNMKVSGKGGLEDFRRILYTVMKPEINLIGQVTQMEIENEDVLNQAMDVILESNPSTGYAWQLLFGSAFIESDPVEYQMHTLGFGVPQRQILHLKRGGNGIGPIRLIYRRTWEETQATCHLTLRFSSLPAKLNLSNPNAPATLEPPLIQPYVNKEVFPVLEMKTLPTQWDWRSQGIVTPIRDQGNCGSCWAFGTVGIMESALWKNGVANKDLSEQFLVSCNKESPRWSCEYGGWTAHKYHYDTLGNNQTVVGAVLEADKPYTATDGSCTAAYQHPYKLTGWQFVTGDEWTVPTVDQIKSAIYTYGPVTAGVCAGNAFQAYQPGTIFATDETASCYGSTNHQIILVGWDDSGQYWILRNSWGTSWGESGYMRIKWDTSRVGEGTSWVTTPKASVNHPLPWLMLLLGN